MWGRLRVCICSVEEETGERTPAGRRTSTRFFSRKRPKAVFWNEAIAPTGNLVPLDPKTRTVLSQSRNTSPNSLAHTVIPLPAALVAPKIDEPKPDLWQLAYKALSSDKEKCALTTKYEFILKSGMGITADIDIKGNISHVLDTKKKAMESKQWTFQWRHRPVKVREQVDRIITIIKIITPIMTSAATTDPTHLGLPIAGVCTLLPLLLNDTDQHEAALDGLEEITRLIGRYEIIVDKVTTQCTGTESKEKFIKTVTSLYTKILEYQIQAICYFGRNTFIRILGNIPKIDDWAKRLQTVKEEDVACERLMNILVWEDQHANTNILKQVMEQQNQLFLEEFAKHDSVLEQGKTTEILSWVSSIPVGDDHEAVQSKLGSCYSASGQWLLTDVEFLKWKNGSSGIFWLRGAVGTGKTSLVFLMIRHFLQEAADERLACFYCSRQQQRSGTVDILRSLLSQVAFSADSASVIPAIKDQYEEDHRNKFTGNKLSLEACVKLLIQAVQSSVRTIIIVDALDECDQPNELLRALRDVSIGSSGVKLFLSSQMHIGVDTIFDDPVGVAINTENASDIEYYIKRELVAPERRKDTGSGMTDDLAERLGAVLFDYSRGMFRWVELQIEIFLHKEEPILFFDDIKEKLGELQRNPGLPSLSEAYDRLYEINLKRDQQTRRTLASKAIKLVLCSVEPLSIEILVEAVALGADGPRRKEISEKLILRICSNFLLLNRDGIVQFAHDSVRTWLHERKSPPDMTEEYSEIEAHKEAAKACLACLEYVGRQASVEETSVFAAVNTHCVLAGFAIYATLNWPTHCRLALSKGLLASGLQEIVSSFLGESESSSSYMEWKSSLPSLRTYQYGNRGALDTHMEMLETIAFAPCDYVLSLCILGLSEFVVDLLDRGLATQRQFEDVDAMSHACILGDLDTVRLLIDTGLDVNRVQGARTNPPLWNAARMGHLAIVHLLLENGAAVSSSGVHNPSPSFGDLFPCTSLFEAVWNGHARVVEVLLRNGADMRDKGLAGQTLLQEAVSYSACSDHIDTVRVLLNHGAAVTETNDKGETALHTVCSCGGIDKYLQWLLDHGADVNAKDINGKTPLHCALEESWCYKLEGNIHILLGNGASVDARDNDGNQAIHFAAQGGPPRETGTNHQNAVKLMLQHGADPNATNANNMTALHGAAKDHRPVDVKVLLENGAVINAKDIQGNQVLHYACQDYRKMYGAALKSTLEILLSHGAELDARNNNGSTPLLEATAVASSDRLQVLLENGANANAKDNQGHQALHYLCQSVYHKEASYNIVKEIPRLVQLLLENGADLDVRDDHGFTPLHLAVAWDHTPYVQTLLSNGARTNIKDKNGNEALHFITNKPNSVIVQMLLAKGASVATKNDYGVTILDWINYATRRDPADLEPSDDQDTDNGQIRSWIYAYTEDLKIIRTLLIKHAAALEDRKPNALTAAVQRSSTTKDLVSVGSPSSSEESMVSCVEKTDQLMCKDM